MTRRPRGIALVLVSAILTLLSLAAVVMVRGAAATRGMSRGLVEVARARLLAASGVEYAMARLTRNPDPAPGAARYGDDWTYRDAATVPLERALNPSYNCGDRYADAGGPGGNRRYVVGEDFVTADRDGNGQYDGWSGRLRGGSAPFGDRFALRIGDESAKINVNGGFLDDGDRDGDGIPDHADPDVRDDPSDPKDTGRGWNFHLARVLDRLGEQPEVGIPDLGNGPNGVLARRPPGGYASVEDLQRRIGTSVDLSAFLTVASWIDRKVVHPNAFVSQAGGGLFYPPNMIKRDRGALGAEEGGRPPVNLNAASRPVLVALLDGLSGISWANEHAPVPVSLDAAWAGAVADAIVSRRVTDPFDTWGEFFGFCDSLVADGVLRPANLASTAVRINGGGNLLYADLLKANFDPNTRIARQIPDRLLWSWVDKTDLTSWSTEGALGPTGTFRIDALGRVRDARGVACAEALRGAMVETFRRIVHTTQADFVDGRRPDLTPTSYLGIAPAGSGASGASATAGAYAWNTWGAGRGVTAMTYPAAMTALPSNACAVDGCVGLATREWTDNLFLLRFLHHFDDAWDADAGGDRVPLVTPSSQLLQQDLSESVWPAPAVEPNTLLPDGAHAQPERSVSFRATPNMPGYDGGNHFVVSYWVKQPAIWGGGALGNDFARTCRIHACCSRRSAGLSQFIATGAARALWGVEFENSVSISDLNREDGRFVTHDGGMFQQMMTPWVRWKLVTARVDTNGTTPPAPQEAGCEAIVQEVRGRSTGFRFYSNAVDVMLNEDVRLSNPPSETLLVLGTDTALQGNGTGVSADQILDEFALYDCGPDPVMADAFMQQHHDERWAEGRYHKEEGTYLSPVLAPDGGRPVRVVRANWTAHLPRDARAEVRIGFVLVMITGPNSPAIPPAGEPAPVDARLFGSAVSLELVDPDAASVLAEPSRGAASGLVLDRFRYRVRLQPNLADPLNEPVLETPFLDDVTIDFLTAAGPRILSWRD